jgi:hypothetical protein
MRAIRLRQHLDQCLAPARILAPMNRFDRGRRKRKWREPVVRVPAVRWTNMPVWLAKTAVVDLRDYDGHRSLTAARLRSLLRTEVRRPIFVVGSPRSGTSFLGGCLGALESISYHREPVAMKAVAQHVWRDEWSPQRTQRTYQLIYRSLLRLHLNGDLRLMDKTPQNAFLVPSLAETFPDAQFIHIVRDGRDATVSYLEKPWVRQIYAWTHRRDPGGQPYGPFAPYWVEEARRAEFESTSDLHRSVWVWRRHVETALEAGEKLPPDRWTEVRYEDLQSDPHAQGDRLADFLGVATDERSRLHEALEAADPGSVGRWRSRLDDAALEVVEHEAGKLLARLGYT